MHFRDLIPRLFNHAILRGKLLLHEKEDSKLKTFWQIPV